MPKTTPDRDDSRGNLAGEGGPQDGPIGNREGPVGDGDAHQQRDRVDTTPSDTGGQDAQRHPGGSSRDSEKLS
jgi:hypothetical protein